MKGYLCPTRHFIDSEWNLESLVIRFERFQTPYKAEIFATCFEDIIEFCEIRSRLPAVKTDKPSKVVAGINILKNILRITPKKHK